jgi:hypothetical protein
MDLDGDIAMMFIATWMELFERFVGQGSELTN